MKYTELYDDFIRLFPEDLEFFAMREKETGVERSDGMHVVFGSVVCPFILKVANENPKKAQKAFDFIEQMEISDDDEVVNVAEVTVLEYVMTDEAGGMKKLGGYLGKESLEAVKHMSQFFKIM